MENLQTHPVFLRYRCHSVPELGLFLLQMPLRWLYPEELTSRPQSSVWCLLLPGAERTSGDHSFPHGWFTYLSIRALLLSEEEITLEISEMVNQY